MTLGSVSCLTFVAGVVAWMGAVGTSLDSSPILAFAWWASLLLGAALGVGACHIDDDANDADYLSSIVAGIRSEWRHTSIRH